MRTILKTFNEWKAHGRHVRKGEKSVGRNKEGVCVFSKQQTDETMQNEYYAREPLDYDNEDYEGPGFDPYFV